MYDELSVFDLDHTLVKVNTSYLFGSYLYYHRVFPLSQLMRCAFYYARHKWLGLSLQQLHQNIFNLVFRGKNLRYLEEHVSVFLEQEFEKMIQKPVFDRLQQAKAKGHYIVILSSSPDFLVGPLAKLFGVQDWQSSFYTANSDGKLEKISQVMEGEDKAKYVQELQQKWGISSASTTVYSDSYLDLPVLRIAGKAVAVAPDSWLRKVCLREGWDILE